MQSALKLLAAVVILVLATVLIHARGEGDRARNAVIEADRQFAQSTAERGLEGFVAWFAEDASILPQGEPAVRGKAAIREFYAKVFRPGFQLKWEPKHGEISRSGDLGYTFGTYEASGSGPDGRQVRRRGKYATFWRKQDDGQWRVVLDVGNSDGPPAAADQATPGSGSDAVFRRRPPAASRGENWM